jgi:hypothetical protein
MQLREKLRRLQAMPHADLVRLASQHSDFENFKHWNPGLPQAKLARFALEAKLEPPSLDHLHRPAPPSSPFTLRMWPLSPTATKPKCAPIRARPLKT